MTFRIITPNLGFPAITDVVTSLTGLAVTVGTKVFARDETLGDGEFIFLKGSASIVANQMCYYSDNAVADSAKLTKTSGVVDGGSPICKSMAAVDATTKYGFFQIGGKATVLKTATKIDPASTFKVYLSATAGRVMPTSVSGRQVLGARFENAATVTTTTSTCIVTLNQPIQQGQIT